MKLKSHSGASKRLKRTGTGKLRHRKGGRRHLLTGKGRDRKRRLKDMVEVSATQRLAVNRLLPYS
jgi:large subunit ribosomal protein L35